uniref:t-SNARE coiled-coil homology domain-containing protein n=1 Tax=Aegilops tauschii subsp. strangulata TaxID=200361 RepID=A0A453IN01_AEGTS
ILVLAQDLNNLPVLHIVRLQLQWTKLRAEKARQDDAFADLSNMLGNLKDMALDMGTEIDRQNKSLDTFSDDVDELNFRVKGANQRGRRLLGK